MKIFKVFGVALDNMPTYVLLIWSLVDTFY